MRGPEISEIPLPNAFGGGQPAARHAGGGYADAKQRNVSSRAGPVSARLRENRGAADVQASPDARRLIRCKPLARYVFACNRLLPAVA